MHSSKLCSISVLAFGALAVELACGAAAERSMKPGPAIEMPQSKGRFDFLRIDPKRHRLLAAHEDDGTADYFDLNTNQLITRVKVGGAVDTAVDEHSERYFVSVQSAKRVAVLDAATLKEIHSIALEGESDAIIFEPRNRMIYVTHDGGANVWVIDPSTNKVNASITVPGVPEYMVYDADADRIYLNIKSADKVAVIEPEAGRVVAQWPTAPASLPHGLALDAKHHRIFSAGGNGKLAAIDTRNGKLVDSIDIAPKVDQIAFDEQAQVVYCAGTGKISLISTAGERLSAAGELTTAATAKNVAVDPATHAVWTTFTDGKASYAKSWIPE